MITHYLDYVRRSEALRDRDSVDDEVVDGGDDPSQGDDHGLPDDPMHFRAEGQEDVRHSRQHAGQNRAKVGERSPGRHRRVQRSGQLCIS